MVAERSAVRRPGTGSGLQTDSSVPCSVHPAHRGAIRWQPAEAVALSAPGEAEPDLADDVSPEQRLPLDASPERAAYVAAEVDHHAARLPELGMG